jgi:WD40 repeat protein
LTVRVSLDIKRSVQPPGRWRRGAAVLRALTMAVAMWTALPPAPVPPPPVIEAPNTGSDLPDDAVLRLEAGMHTAMIPSISVDGAGRLLLTVSLDKTARLWSLPDGQLLRVLRPPIGPGNEGKLYAGALSPDGRMIAVGGWYGWDREAAGSAFLFDTDGGRLARRLRDLSDVITCFSFSPDGQRLAAGLGGSGGIQMWETASGQELLADGTYENEVHGLAFAADGRLAVTSFDGRIRLYGQDLQPLREVKAPGGERPFAIAFSPDGSRVAVSYENVKRVDVLNSRDLTPLFQPDVAGGDAFNLGSVVWSADGRFLFAGGAWAKDGKVSIRRWSDGGRGASLDIPIAGGTIQDLKPYGRDGVLYAASGPVWGAVNGLGTIVKEQTSVLADLRNNDDGFAVGRDGRRVRFELKDRGKNTVLFDLAARLLEAPVLPFSDLTPPRTDGLPVTGWENTTTPQFAGRPLPLKPYETSRRLAIAPPLDGFVLGTEWSLRAYDVTGEERWHQPMPDTVWGVNVSGDGRMVVAACGDGTIRWHRLSDGEELLALFVDARDKRWVVWTPSGYYLASPGGEALIGWHVNTGPDNAAKFYAVDRFRDTFSRPDVVDRILDTLDEDEALRQADQARRTR